MASKHDHDFDVSKPFLVLLYGNSSKKNHSLDRDVTVIGRARGCDFGLDAPDISSLHCVITRGIHGFRVRDCQSRCGTKLNGENVTETALHDGDLLQVGTFSFNVHLPAAAAPAAAKDANAQQQHLQHSRRNLARIALRQRNLLRLKGGQTLSANGKTEAGKINQQLATLQTRIRENDKRVRALEEAERDLAKDREKLEREIAAFRARAEQSEQEINRPVEEKQRQSATLRQDFSRQQQEILHQRQALEREREEFSMTRDQWARDQGSILSRLGQQKTALALAEEMLHEQRQDLDDVLTQLQESHAEAEHEASGALADLHAENEQLRQLLAQRPSQGGASEEELRQVKAENEEIKHLLAEMQRNRERGSAANPGASDEIALLYKQIEEKDAQLEELRRQAAPREDRDIDSYEAELNATQRQLETDRQKLKGEIEQLKARNQELDEATRDMELEMSRERAELGRERQRLDRLRDEVRLELERMQRDSGLRDRLAPVQNLREQMTSRKQPNGDAKAKPAEDPSQVRLRALRNKVSEGSGQ